MNAPAAVRSPLSATPEDAALSEGLTLAELLDVIGIVDVYETGTP